MPKAKTINTTSPSPIISGKTAVALAVTIDRLKQIAAEAQDHLLLSDGPPQPDHTLLDLCSEILHLMKRDAELKERRDAAWEARGNSEAEKDKYRALCDSITNETRMLGGRLKTLLCQAKKLSATTAAGIYAKALVCRYSVTGAAGMAMTLANDLVNTPDLRASIWPNEGRGA